MKRFVKTAITVCAAGLLAVSTAVPATADLYHFDNDNFIRVSNRSWRVHEACVSIENAFGFIGCHNIGVRDTYTWRYSYDNNHPEIKVTVYEPGKREYADSFKANEVASNLCFRFSGSGSFHRAKKCKI